MTRFKSFENCLNQLTLLTTAINGRLHGVTNHKFCIEKSQLHVLCVKTINLKISTLDSHDQNQLIQTR